MCFISIIIPAYNVEKYIPVTIQSILNSEEVDKTDYEIIVVNDGSTDNTLQVVKEVQKNNPDANITLLSQRNCGVSAARNYGLEKANGKFVWFVDGDDFIVSSSLKLLITVIKEYEVDVIKIGKVIRNAIEKEDLTFQTDDVANSDISQNKVTDACEMADFSLGFGHTTFIWKTSLLIDNRLRYPENIAINEDFVFVLNSLNRASHALFNPTFQFYVVRARADSVSRKNKYSRTFGQYHKVQSSMLMSLVLVLKVVETIDVSNQKKLKKYNDVINQMTWFNVYYAVFSSPNMLALKYTLCELKALGKYPIPNIDKYTAKPIIGKILNQKFSCYIFRYIWHSWLFRHIVKPYK